MCEFPSDAWPGLRVPFAALCVATRWRSSAADGAAASEERYERFQANLKLQDGVESGLSLGPGAHAAPMLVALAAEAVPALERALGPPLGLCPDEPGWPITQPADD